MAKIGIWEPDPEVRTILVRAATRLGHDPLPADVAIPRDGLDLVLVEPADGRSRETVARLADADVHLRIICVSIHPPELPSLPFKTVSYLLKPFALADLQNAIEQALKTGARQGVVRGLGSVVE